VDIFFWSNIFRLCDDILILKGVGVFVEYEDSEAVPLVLLYYIREVAG